MSAERAVYVITYCTHCFSAVGCYIEGIESLGASCDRCNHQFCTKMKPDKTVGTLCPDCNWNYDYEGDCCGHS